MDNGECLRSLSLKPGRQFVLKDMGFGTGLYPTPPYVCVKVPVFSFEKLSDANSRLGP